MMVYSVLYGLLFLALQVVGPTPTNQNPTLLLTRNNDQHCANFEVYDYGENNQYYKQVVTKRDDAAFYYSDEDKQEVIIQRKNDQGIIIVKYVFVAHKKTYEIILKSCLEHLSENKKELYTLQQKLYSKQTL